MSKSYQVTVCFLSLLLGACGSDSSGPGNGANVVIVSGSSSGVAVQNIGGAGEFYVEAWGQATFNAPGGDSPTLIRLWTSPVTPAPAGYHGTLSMGSGSASRWIARTRVGSSSDYFQSSCWGSC